MSQEVVALEGSVNSQKQVLGQEESKYMNVLNALTLTDSKIQAVQKRISDLTVERDRIVKEVAKLDSTLKFMEANDLFNLQKEIKDNEVAI